MPSRLSPPRSRRSCSVSIILALGLIIADLTPNVANAHLCIIRQGRESAGALEAGDRYGAALASGDFDHDGYADLIVGSPTDDVLVSGNNVVDAGAVVVSYGSPTGLTPGNAHSMTQTSLGYASGTNDRFGATVAVGNFNNDAYDDAAIAAPGESLDGNAGAGNVIIVYGAANGLRGGTFLVSQSNSPGVAEAGDNFGFALATGDFNNDGYDDLAVGVPGENLESAAGDIVDAGAVEIYFGGPSGLTTAGAYIITDDDTINAAQTGARFGHALASGRFNNGSYDDLAVGLPGKSVSGASMHGVIEVLFGSASGILAGGAQLLSQVSFGGTSEVGDQFGYSLAAGRANNDALDDLAVGVPFKDNGVATNGGIVFVAYGGATGLRIDNATLASPTVFGSTSNDNFGLAVALGDWTGDGRAELAVGMPGRNVGGVVGAGIVAIFAADDNGIRNNAMDITRHNQATLNEVGETNDQLGAALAFGAFAGGTRQGLAIGAPLENYEPMPGIAGSVLADAGAVYIDMPWRQVQGLSCRTSMVTDCDLNVIFSQKPFEQHYIASTTKIMTALLAIEATQPGCSPCAQMNDVYIVPGVLTNNANAPGSLGGSLANLCPGELVTLNNLIFAMMLPSGNDAAYCIADHIASRFAYCNNVGCADIANFATMMNTRAAQLGMTQTSYQNPSGGLHGSWASANFSTANDMAILAYNAMLNATFRNYVATANYNWPRNAPGCLPNNTVTPLTTGVFTLPGGAGPDFPGASGLKPGSNGNAGRTFVASVEHVDGRLFAVALGSTTTASSCSTFGNNVAANRCDVVRLLALGTDRCSIPLTPAPAPPGLVVNIEGVPSDHDSARTIPLFMDEMPDRPMRLRAALSHGTTAANGLLRVHGRHRKSYQPLETFMRTVTPFESHEGYRIVNTGDAPVLLQITLNQPASSSNVTLLPGQSYDIPAYRSPTRLPDVSLSVLNLTSSGAADVEIIELGYMFNLQLSEAAGPAFEASIFGNVPGDEESLDADYRGADSAPGTAVDLTAAKTIDTDPNCDGLLDTDDLQAFVMALLSPSAYFQSFPACYIGSADRNADSRIDGDDIAVFVREVLGR